MPNVEDDGNLRARRYDDAPLQYFYDPARDRLEWVFNEVGLHCGGAGQEAERICQVPLTASATLTQPAPCHFVYLDVGAWGDDPVGDGHPRRDFALIAGPHVYLCEYTGGREVPRSRVPIVQQFFDGQGGVRVRKYARARAVPGSSPTGSDNDPSTLTLLLGDLHLPPASWFYTAGDTESSYTRPLITAPDLLTDTEAWQSLSLAPIYYTLTQRLPRTRPVEQLDPGWLAEVQDCLPGSSLALRPFRGNPDVFGASGEGLTAFLDDFAALEPALGPRLNFAQLGDIFELWMGREPYQFRGSTGSRPVWISESDSPATAARWLLESMIQNYAVYEVIRRLQDDLGDRAKIVYGNHDAYLMSDRVTSQCLRMPPTRGEYYAQNCGYGLYAEHGHRWDPGNYDSTDSFGADVTNLVAAAPGLRSMDGFARSVAYAGRPTAMQLGVQGATLLWFLRQSPGHGNPFAIYAKGHTHHADLLIVDRIEETGAPESRYEVRADADAGPSGDGDVGPAADAGQE